MSKFSGYKMNLLSTLLIGISQSFLVIKEILLAVCSDVVSIYVPFIMVELYGSSNISREKGRIKWISTHFSLIQTYCSDVSKRKNNNE